MLAILETHEYNSNFLGISPLMTGEEMTKTEDLLTMSSYLTEIYHTFRCEIPHINHPKLVSFYPIDYIAFVKM